MTGPWAWIVLVLALVPVVAIMIWALADLARRPDVAARRKALWMIVVVALPLVGAVLYLVFRPARRADLRGFGGPNRPPGGRG